MLPKWTAYVFCLPNEQAEWILIEIQLISKLSLASNGLIEFYLIHILYHSIHVQFPMNDMESLSVYAWITYK